MKMTGIHVTFEENWHSIQENGWLKSEGIQWMGEGVYLWGYSNFTSSMEEMADFWTEHKKRKSGRNAKVARIKTKIEVAKNDLFDQVFNAVHKKIFEKAKSHVLRSAVARDHRTKKRLEPEIYDLIREGKNYKVLRGFFITGELHTPFSGAVNPHIQICVCDIDCIVSAVEIDPPR